MWHKSKLKAESLLEVTISLMLVVLCMVMLSNILVNAVRISQATIGRSLIREEMASIISSLGNDIRGATSVPLCQGSIETDYTQVKCTIIGSTEVDWTVIWDSTLHIYRIQRAQGVVGSQTVTYISPKSMSINQLSFDVGFNASQSVTKQNILITLVASHTNSMLNIKNLIEQVTISTRNYDI